MSKKLVQIKNAHRIPAAIQLMLIPGAVYVANNDLLPEYLHYTSGKLMLLIPVVAAGALFFGGSYFRKKVRAATNISGFSGKLTAYRNVVLIRSLALLAVSLCGQAAFVLSNYPYYLLLCLFAILMYGILTPTHKTVARDLLLSEHEQNELIAK